MPDFTFVAVTKDNGAESGQITAASPAEAIAELESRGLTVRSLQQVENAQPSSGTSPSYSADPSGSGVSDDKFLRERITAILEKRETLAPALSAFAEEMPMGRRRRELRRLAVRLRNGATVDELCQAKDRTTTWLPLLGGTSSLDSSRLLSDLFAESSRENAMRSQWTRSFAYPLFILVASIAVFVFLSVTIVPGFGELFIDFGLVLPKLTVLVVSFSRLVRFQFGLLLLITAGCLLAVYVVFRLLKALRFPSLLLDALTNGGSRQLTVMAAFVRRLAESLNSGRPLPTALRLAGQSSGKPWLLHETAALAHGLETDWAEHERPPWAANLPPSVVYALRAGPEGGPSVPLLQEMAEIYAERVRNRFDWSTGFLPHVAILAVGFVVAMVVLALFLPLISLVNGLS
jgi:type II secretory pathway component PulF